MQPSTRILVFLKAPRAGFVKTRLAASMGEPAALNAYRRLTEITLSCLEESDQVELRITPDDAHSEVHHWKKERWDCQAQGGGDLGERLERAFRESFGAGFKKVIVIGTDCPCLSRLDLEAAEAALDQSNLVLGPAEDGGYWLLGSSQHVPELFRDIPWSTSGVLDATLRKAETNGMNVTLLRKLEDVDTEAEWLRHINRPAPDV